MATIIAFSATEKTSHNTHKFAFTLSLTNYGLWKAMVEPLLITNHIIGYLDDTIQCPEQKITTKTVVTDNPSYPRWVANDAHVGCLFCQPSLKLLFNMFKVRPLEICGYH